MPCAELTSVDLKEAALLEFLAERPEWKERLSARAPGKGSEEARSALLDELLPELGQHVRSQPEIWERLQRLRDNAQRSSQAKWRLDVRRAALLRMRSVLLHIAARTLLAEDGSSAQASAARDEQREALARLQQCEALAMGPPPRPGETGQAPITDPYPPLADELALLDRILPSWLGVRFKAVPKSVREQDAPPVGATLIQAVYPNSPAAAAGLESGDIVLGPPGRPFGSRKQLRE